MSLTFSRWKVSRYFSVRASHLSAEELTTVLRPYAILIYSLGAACDILIASAIVFSLHKFQKSWSRGAFKRTNDLLIFVMVFSVTSGIVLSLCAILVLSLSAGYPEINIAFPFYLVLPRLYANSVLVTLNVRNYLQEHHTRSGWFTSGDFDSNFRLGNTNSVDRRNEMHELDEPSARQDRICTQSEASLEEQDHNEKVAFV
ncbi:hypothetical protein GYMLUDRAFT_245162 [Collybiopsis luxurians FD-317 M1]|uniref:DUF6534 domain-containing protein n=1 Tax=Collybiopsis luxurians FD-317 M1 TaxID=944289 RepID=A0A0D0BVD5_9AGAR|nr:hypothetical protein GYMLUDRAFT_245162 [Collybiopsis luxurians FD-317 M1]